MEHINTIYVMTFVLKVILACEIDPIACPLNHLGRDSEHDLRPVRTQIRDRWFESEFGQRKSIVRRTIFRKRSRRAVGNDRNE